MFNYDFNLKFLIISRIQGRTITICLLGVVWVTMYINVILLILNVIFHKKKIIIHVLLMEGELNL